MSDIHNRKADHIRITLEDDIEFHQQTNGFEHFQFRHCCLPEMDREDVRLDTQFLGKTLHAPLLISSMTGGTEQAKIINSRLAEIAQKYRLAMGVGSQRVAIENPDIAHTFSVRSLAPDILLFANLGAIQLNNGLDANDCLRIVESLQADALILHLNPLQECIQEKGNTNFKGLLNKIEMVCKQLSIPVIAKEVGNGISAEVANKLIDAGVQAIDVAGAGGTSWAKVESARATNPLQRDLGTTFAEWGVPTAECIVAIREAHPHIPLIASGGIRDGLDVAKAIALGADLAGLALPFLQPATDSIETLDNFVQRLLAELTTALFCTGNADLTALQNSNALIHRRQSSLR
jgi:isopentenyl-diphosphate Delta-isomerase